MGPPAKDTLSMQNVKLMLLIDKKDRGYSNFWNEYAIYFIE